MPSELLKQPALLRLMVMIALLVLPVVAWVDYRQGLLFTAGVEMLGGLALLGLAVLVPRLGVRRAARLTLLVVFTLACLGSIEKLDSTPNFAWLTVMPFLYISVGGLRFGGALSVCHLLFIVACYASFAQHVAVTISTGTWLQVAAAYLTAGGLAFSYEQVQRQLRARLRALAEHDSLTGLLNRRGMEKRLNELGEFRRRHDVAVTLALLDVDHFKRVNDEHGHDVGDAVLRELGNSLRRVFRSSDYLARWGGEEFLIALTNTEINDAAAVLERLRAEVAGPEQQSLPAITLSMGAAEWRPGMALGAALKQADLALYEAKGQGRDTLVVVAEDKRRSEPLPLTA